MAVGIGGLIALYFLVFVLPASLRRRWETYKILNQSECDLCQSKEIDTAGGQDHYICKNCGFSPDLTVHPAISPLFDDYSSLERAIPLLDKAYGALLGASANDDRAAAFIDEAARLQSEACDILRDLIQKYPDELVPPEVSHSTSYGVGKGVGAIGGAMSGGAALVLGVAADVIEGSESTNQQSLDEHRDGMLLFLEACHRAHRGAKKLLMDKIREMRSSGVLDGWRAPAPGSDREGDGFSAAALRQAGDVEPDKDIHPSSGHAGGLVDDSFEFDEADAPFGHGGSRKIFVVVGAVIGVLLLFGAVFMVTDSNQYKSQSMEAEADEHAAEGRLEQATEAYKEAMTLFKGQPASDEATQRVKLKLCTMHREHAQRMASQEDLGITIEAYAAALRWCTAEYEALSEAYFRLLLRFADERAEAGDYVEAVKAYDKVFDGIGESDQLFEPGEILKKRKACLVKQGDAFAKEGRLLEAGKAYVNAAHYEKAIETYRKGEHWVQLGSVLSSQGQDFEAGEAYSKAERWKKAADSFERAGKLELAADAFMKVPDERQAAALYEIVGQQAKLAQAFAAMASQDEDVMLRIYAARAFKAAGDKKQSKLFYNQALDVAMRFDDIGTIMLVHDEMGTLGKGFKVVLAKVQALITDKEFHEAQELTGALIGFINGREAEKGKPKISRRHIVKLISTIQTLKDELDKYPEILDIKGVNQSTVYGRDEYEIFEQTIIEGVIENDTDADIASVSIRVRLFKKDLDQFADRGWSDISDEAKKRFGDAEAGYIEWIEISDLKRGEKRRFKKTLSNDVPYMVFDQTMSKLKLAAP